MVFWRVKGSSLLFGLVLHLESLFLPARTHDADRETHRWDHETNKQGDEGFMGKVQAFRKKADAKLVEKTVPSDPSKV